MAKIRLNGIGITGETEYSSFGVPTFGDFLNPNIDTEVVARTYKIKIKADAGFIMTEISYNGNYGMTEYVDISEDGLTAEFSRAVTDAVTLTINVTTEEDAPPKEISGFNHLYLVNREILKSISRERFKIVGQDGIIDLGVYIINVLELPFIISSGDVGEMKEIVLGNFELATESPELNTDELTIDFGEIEIPYKFNNSYDFINTKTILHLPYSGSIELDINYVVNQKIRVVYIIDLYSGNTTINIFSSLIDNIIQSENTKLGRNIPFINGYSNENIGNISDNATLLNGILKPFVEVIRNIPYQLDNVFNKDVEVQGRLSGVNGFITVNDIELNSNATNNEKQGIINLLKNGVYIK